MNQVSKEEVMRYLMAQYEKTKWPFIRYSVLIKLYGLGVKEILNELRNDGKIKGREAINDKLIEIVL